MTGKITHTELEAIFGRPWVPIRAVRLMMDWSGTIDGLRERLHDIAAQERGKKARAVRLGTELGTSGTKLGTDGAARDNAC